MSRDLAPARLLAELIARLLDRAAREELGEPPLFMPLARPTSDADLFFNTAGDDRPQEER